MTAAATAQSEIDLARGQRSTTPMRRPVVKRAPTRRRWPLTWRHPTTRTSTARSTARNARQTAEQAQTELETHRNSTHNTDVTARTAIEEHIPLDTVHGIPAVAARVLALENAAPAGGGAPTVLFDGAFDAGTSMGKLTGDIVCPETGDVELYARSTSGDRPGWSGYIKMSVRRPKSSYWSIWYCDSEYVDQQGSGGMGRQPGYGLGRRCHQPSTSTLARSWETHSR